MNGLRLTTHHCSTSAPSPSPPPEYAKAHSQTCEWEMSMFGKGFHVSSHCSPELSNENRRQPMVRHVPVRNSTTGSRLRTRHHPLSPPNKIIQITLTTHGLFVRHLAAPPRFAYWRCAGFPWLTSPDMNDPLFCEAKRITQIDAEGCKRQKQTLSMPQRKAAMYFAALSSAEVKISTFRLPELTS
ncbi:hypothetical protein EX30DRAFT_205103 [Ascodesmis nigricans]|uniref:Uncharacterized protein n=1 Tax=Ascodesmis nigricans TaxID=341454 RepID=A0A4S2MPT3_9PEZI|nr:hypothetical protein EX30DRAFT_205103 [Ascodesmis nigricans]